MQHGERDFVHQGVAAFKCCQIGNGGVGNILQSSIGKIGLVRSHNEMPKEKAWRRSTRLNPAQMIVQISNS